MAEVIGSFLYSLFSSKVDKLTSQKLKDFLKGNGIDEEHLKDLRMLLLSVTTVLSDSEKKQFVDPWVNEWIDELKSCSYEADDIIDEILTKARYSRNPISPLNIFSKRPQSKVQDIVERLRSLVELKDILIGKESNLGKLLSLSSETSSLVDERRVYGRNDDKEKIINFLLSDFKEVELPIVAIVGMVGCGKTTIAQILFNDSRVMSNFQSRAWVSVSENSTMTEISKKVLQSFTFSQSDFEDFNNIHIKLKQELEGKRFLLILDGYENESYHDWEVFERAFVLASPGSRIIVTSRSKRVATSIRANLIHIPPFLSDEAGWELFSSHAFNSQNSNEQSRVLRKIGKRIVERCGGLPQAIVTLGSLLNSKEDYEEWENISNSKLWDLSREKDNIFSALISIYTRLPSYLKRCFSFCAIYPKGYKIDKWNLIYLWMAEGFLPQSTALKRMEDIGEEFFEDLVSKTFFYHTSDGYLMHNLVHELAEYVAGKFYHKLEHSVPSTFEVSSVHCISYLQGIYDDKVHFCMYSDCKSLRTFMPFKFSPVDGSEVASSILNSVSTLLKEPKPMRVFSLSWYPICLLPSSIGDLLHLRYLDLSWTLVVALPDSICGLYNLETLLLVGCAYLTALPTNTSFLINLRQLDIRLSGIKKMPINLGKLKSLQVLPHFVVSDDGGSNVGVLGEMLELHGSLSIVNLQNVVIGEEASKVGLKYKKYLHEVELKWTTPTHNEESENIIFDMLEPHPNLKKLKIHNFGGDKFPNWLGSSSSSTMMFLCIDECRNCLSLPSLGQLSNLSELYITTISRLQKVGPEFYGNGIEAFCSLRIIKFKDLPNWEEWSADNRSGNEGFNLLQELYIEGCPKLIGKLPSNLPSLDKLVISSCQTLSDTMPCVPKLRELDITGCEAFVSLSEHLFPKLEVLCIEDCSSLQTILSTANNLPFLQKLKLKNCSKLAFIFEGGFSTLTYLTSLHLESFPRLTSLENIGIEGLTSLKMLTIEDCGNLASLPIVTSLSHLAIRRCPLLKLQCERDTGKYWKMVSSIPFTSIKA